MTRVMTSTIRKMKKENRIRKQRDKYENNIRPSIIRQRKLFYVEKITALMTFVAHILTKLSIFMCFCISYLEVGILRESF